MIKVDRDIPKLISYTAPFLLYGGSCFVSWLKGEKGATMFTSALKRIGFNQSMQIGIVTPLITAVATDKVSSNCIFNAYLTRYKNMYLKHGIDKSEIFDEINKDKTITEDTKQLLKKEIEKL